MVTIGLRERELEWVKIWKIQKKSNYAKTEGSIKIISKGFAAKATTNVLKFGDSRPKGRGVTGADLRKIEEKD